MIAFPDERDRVPIDHYVALVVNPCDKRYGQIARVRGLAYRNYNLEFSYDPFSDSVNHVTRNFCDRYHSDCSNCAIVPRNFTLKDTAHPILLFNRLSPEFGDKQGLNDLVDNMTQLNFSLYKAHNPERTSFTIFSDYFRLFGEPLLGIEDDRILFAMDIKRDPSTCGSIRIVYI